VGVVVGDDEVSVGVGEPLVEPDGLADGEAVADFVGVADFFGFGLPVLLGVGDGGTRTRVGLGSGVGVGLLAAGVGVTGAVLMCCAVLLCRSPVFRLELWLVR
jgi:hypothetical protein